MIQVMVSTQPSNLIRPRLKNFFFSCPLDFSFLQIILKQRTEKLYDHCFPDLDCLTTSTGVMATAAASVAVPRHVHVQD